MILTLLYLAVGLRLALVEAEDLKGPANTRAEWVALIKSEWQPILVFTLIWGPMELGYWFWRRVIKGKTP